MRVTVVPYLAAFDGGGDPYSDGLRVLMPSRPDKDKPMGDRSLTQESHPSPGRSHTVSSCFAEASAVDHACPDGSTGRFVDEDE